MKLRVKSKEEIECEYRIKDFILTLLVIIGITIFIFGLIEFELWIGNLINSILK